MKLTEEQRRALGEALTTKLAAMREPFKLNPPPTYDRYYAATQDDSACAYCSGGGTVTDTEGVVWPCPQGCKSAPGKWEVFSREVKGGRGAGGEVHMVRRDGSDGSTEWYRKPAEKMWKRVSRFRTASAAQAVADKLNRADGMSEDATARGACSKCGGKVADCPYLPQHCPAGVAGTLK